MRHSINNVSDIDQACSLPAMSTPQNSPQYSAVDKVPDDTLLEIFHHLLAPPGIALQDSDTWVPVTLSHVCSSWRCLTLVSPLLWTNIFLPSFSDPDILRQYLTRSIDALLRVDITTPITSMPDALVRTLSNQTYRFISFHLYDVYADTVERVLPFFTSPAPVLRSLHIHPFLQAWVETVFDNQMPLLTDMEIFGGGDEDNGPMLGRKNLTRLRVCMDYVEAEKLVNLLRACPTLESLDLSFRGLDSDDDLRRPGGIPMIPLKFLKELHMDWPGVTDMTIFPYLSFPTTITVKIGYFAHELEEPVTPVLRNCASLREMVSDVKKATLELSQRLPNYKCISTIRSPHLEIEVYSYRTDLEDREFTGFSAMPFPALSHLTIRDMGCSFPEHQWHRMFQRIPTITHLEICAKDAITLAILRVIGTDTSGAETVLCPELTHLVLSGEVDERQAICEELLSCCLARAAAGAPAISCEIVLEARDEILAPVLVRLNEIGVRITVRHTNPVLIQVE
ncbi:hypothetical protein B0H21DRAFT_489946 [Amylocystis lapponica]|nr:hypothetical protein B0H21DRAFT_489946 [Amylocystis lapponica]